MRLKKLTLTAALTAAALVMFVLESQLPPLTAIPGIKPGLSNIFTLFTMETRGPGWAFGLFFTLRLAPRGELRLCELIGLHERPVRRAAERAAAAFHAEVDLQLGQPLHIARLIGRDDMRRHEPQRTVADAPAAADAGRRFRQDGVRLRHGEDCIRVF